MSAVYRSIDCDESAETVGAFPVLVQSILAINVGTGLRYLKLYDGAAPVVGVDTPVLTIPVPHGDTTGSGLFCTFKGIQINTQLWIACTTGVADNDVGAPAQNEVIVHVEYNRLVNGSPSG